MLLTFSFLMNSLMDQGIHRREILMGARASRKVRNERLYTPYKGQFDMIHELAEGTIKRFRKKMGWRESSKVLLLKYEQDCSSTIDSASDAEISSELPSSTPVVQSS